MTRTRSIATLAASVIGTTLLFWIVLHQISAVWLDVALRPEVRAALERSLEDQKKLRSLDPGKAEEYRRRFEETRTLLNRINVIRLNREAMLRRFEIALLAIFAAAAAVAAFMLWSRYREAQERERREYVERVAALQQTARRHAHELKGPLTAARLELERSGDLVRAAAPREEIERAHQSVGEEIERLARYARGVASFAALTAPVMRRESIGEIVQEFCRTFADAWPGVRLMDEGGDAVVCADRDMLRQVLVNLCSNSARAGASSVSFSVTHAGGRPALDVRDTGEGVPESLRARVFDPYVTTTRPGEGMGLGLSIARKVMLDQGGDLVLTATGSGGTTFRLVFREV